MNQLPTRSLRRVKPRRTDKVTWGIHLSFLSAELIEFCGVLGFEWLFLDAQHTTLNPHVCRDLVRAADAVEMFCMVRVPRISAQEIEAYLDLGVQGILAPDVSSAAQARKLVAAVKYCPEGNRGAASRSRAACYGLVHSAGDYCRAANQETFTAALIESQRGIDAIDSIMAVPGLDYVAIGANDLGLSLGSGAGTDDPRVRSMVDEARTRIATCGKPQMVVVPDAEQARLAAARGAELIAVSDAALLANAGRSFFDAISPR